MAGRADACGTRPSACSRAVVRLRTRRRVGRGHRRRLQGLRGTADTASEPPRPREAPQNRTVRFLSAVRAKLPPDSPAKVAAGFMLVTTRVTSHSSRLVRAGFCGQLTVNQRVGRPPMCRYTRAHELGTKT
jgi:hypothetical protein